MHLVYPENFAFCFQFLLDITVIPREILNIEKNVDANKVHYGLYIWSIYVKIVNQWISI